MNTKSYRTTQRNQHETMLEDIHTEEKPKENNVLIR